MVQRFRRFFFLFTGLCVLGQISLGQQTRGELALPQIFQEKRVQIDAARTGYREMINESLKEEVKALAVAYHELWETGYIDEQIKYASISDKEKKKVRVLLDKIRASIHEIDQLSNTEIPLLLKRADSVYVDFGKKWEAGEMDGADLKKRFKKDVSPLLKTVGQHQKKIKSQVVYAIVRMALYANRYSQTDISVAPELTTNFIKYSNRFAEGSDEIRLTEELVFKREELDHVNALLKDYRFTLDSTKGNLSLLKKQNKDLKTENIVLESDISQISQTRDSLNMILKKMENELQRANRDITATSEALAKNQAAIFNSEQALVQNKQENAALEDQANILGSEIQSLRDKERALVSRIGNLERTSLLTVLLLVSILVLTVMYFKFHRLRNSNRTIEKKNEELRKAHKKLENYLLELPHRVKNNLQDIGWLIRMQYYEMEHDEAKSALKKAMDRIEAISLLHKHLYSPEQKRFTTIEIKQYVEELIEFYKDRPDGKVVEFDLDIEAIHMEISTAMHIGLLINEIVSNAFKHAFPKVEAPRLSAQIYTSESWIHVNIQDNGPGLPQNGHAQNGHSSGMGLIKNIVEDEGGKLYIDSSEGTRYSIDFPLTERSYVLEKES